MENKMLCPIINEYIGEDDCFDVHMVIEGTPKRTALAKIINTPNYKNICLNCKNHRDD